LDFGVLTKKLKSASLALIRFGFSTPKSTRNSKKKLLDIKNEVQCVISGTMNSSATYWRYVVLSSVRSLPPASSLLQR